MCIASNAPHNPLGAPPLHVKCKSVGKRVRFASMADVGSASTPCRQDLTQEQSSDCWWTPQENLFVRRRNAEFVKQVESKAQRAIVSLEATYKAVVLLPADEELYISENPERICRHLKRWASKGLRGLERCVYSRIHAVCHATSVGSRQIVLRMQDQGVDAEDIARHYSNSCRPSRIFARLLGHADLLTVEHLLECEQDDSSTVMERKSTTTTSLPSNKKCQNHKQTKMCYAPIQPVARYK